jgi:hypothetical protein
MIEKRVIYTKDEIEFLKKRAEECGFNSVKAYVKNISLKSNVIIELEE